MTQRSPAIEAALQRVIGKALEARQRGDGRPFMVGHFITNRCMCKCASCLWRDNESKDVGLEDLKRFYAQARDEGFVAAALTGGEPFLRSDLGEVVRFIKQEAGMSVLLFNTGWYLKKRMDEVLPYIDMMIVSLDSARAERHDAIRGLPGLFETGPSKGCAWSRKDTRTFRCSSTSAYKRALPRRSTTSSLWRKVSP